MAFHPGVNRKSRQFLPFVKTNFGMKHCIVDLYQVCSNGDPRVKTALGWGGRGGGGPISRALTENT